MLISKFELSFFETQSKSNHKQRFTFQRFTGKLGTPFTRTIYSFYEVCRLFTKNDIKAKIKGKRKQQVTDTLEYEHILLDVLNVQINCKFVINVWGGTSFLAHIA